MRSEAIASQHAGRAGAGQRKEQGRQQLGVASGLQVAARRLQEGWLTGLGVASWPRGGGRATRGGARGCRGGERAARGGARGCRGGSRAAMAKGGPQVAARRAAGAASRAAGATRGA
ncbi:unnamed protein product [Closterium sp. NIES-54]